MATKVQVNELQTSGIYYLHFSTESKSLMIDIFYYTHSPQGRIITEK